ncbi:MAG TPA: aminopeptidase [Chthonomonadales bacterium]|nr:aminopeptidase [Chthonomonadales bacterium]
MRDPRFDALSRVLVEHSTRLQPGEKVLIEAFDIPTDFTAALIGAVSEAGGLPLVSTYHQPVLRALYRAATKDQMRTIGMVERERMEAVQCYIGLRGTHNANEMGDVPSDRMDLYEKHWWRPVHSEVRIRRTKWVVLRWPSPSMAQSASMSTEAFEDFFFRVCVGVDYARLGRAMVPLVEKMAATDRVRIVGPGTDLTFSIAGIPAVPCSGERNIPDGEVFTAPVRDSAEGVLTVNTETLNRGVAFRDVRLTFRSGRIVDATAGDQTARLNEILGVDEGARYLGEWALGVNPLVLTPMRDTLFDEKIAGSFHLTPGEAYDEADNGNRSQIHWDLVCIQRPEYGGGEIWFDDELVRRDGLFVADELAALNPEQLLLPDPA